MKRVIFLHGVGSSGHQMEPLAEALEVTSLGLESHCPDGPGRFPHGTGHQWFSLDGITEENRTARIAAAMPAFRTIVESFGNPRESLLIGFSQGTIMALHALADGLSAAGVLGLSGRLAGPVPARPGWPPITLIHGRNDPIMPLPVAEATVSWLKAAGAVPTLLILDGLGHAIDERVLAAAGAWIRERLAQNVSVF